MDAFQIRDARSADRESIALLWRELILHHKELDPRFSISTRSEDAYLRHILDMMRSRNSRVLVARPEQSNEIVGYVMGELQVRPIVGAPDTYGFISDISVSGEWRGHGVGTALVGELKRWFTDRKAVAIELYVADRNPGAARFWEKMGLSPFLKLLHMDL